MEGPSISFVTIHSRTTGQDLPIPLCPYLDVHHNYARYWTEPCFFKLPSVIGSFFTKYSRRNSAVYWGGIAYRSANPRPTKTGLALFIKQFWKGNQELLFANVFLPRPAAREIELKKSLICDQALFLSYLRRRNKTNMCHRQLRFVKTTPCGHLTFIGDTNVDCGSSDCYNSTNHPSTCGTRAQCRCRRYFDKPERIITGETQGPCSQCP